MKIEIFVSLILSFALCSIKLVPYPKDVSYGTETIVVSNCEVFLDLPKDIEQSFSHIIDVHKDLILSDRNLCSTTANNYPIRVIQNPSVSESKCDSEEYTLEITSKGIHISMNCPIGLIRAIATLYQLININDDMIIIENIPLEIKDSPRFKYRGVMVDSSRHFLPIPILKRIIDGMMLAKLNVLHWHLVDDDSFTMQSKHIPGLAESAAFTKEEMYTIEQIKDLEAYAKDKGVEIMPEIDNPGHSRAIGKFSRFNPITTCFNRVWSFNLKDHYRIHGGPPSSALDPSMDLTYEYMTNVIKDLIDYFRSDFILIHKINLHIELL